MASQQELADQHEKRLQGRVLKRMSKKDKIKQMRLNFYFFDTDQSGSLSADEFLKLLTMQCGSKDSPITLSDAQEILHDFDTDGNGTLEIEEFIQAMCAMDPELADEVEDDTSLWDAAESLDASAIKLDDKEAGEECKTTEYG